VSLDDCNQGRIRRSDCPYPQYIFDIPQDGHSPWISIDIQFKQQREFFTDKYSRAVTNLLSVIQTARDAKIRVFEKVVLKIDKRNYKWHTNNLWDKSLLPEIDVNQCTPQYLYNICNAINQIRLTKDVDYILEPVLVIKYELLPHVVIGSSNCEQLFGDKVKILAPIVDFFIQ
jgi:hypothetical protein